MKLYEIDKSDIKRKFNDDYKKAIAAGYYIERNNNFVKNAFNFGKGGLKEIKEYMKNNKVYCVWIDFYTLHPVTENNVEKYYNKGDF